MRRMKMISITLVAAAAMWGQAGPAPPPHAGMMGPGHFGFGPGGPPWKVVTAAPYTATATTQFTQRLADGNTIQRNSTGTVARDSQGRTYSEEKLPAGPFGSQGESKQVIFISDPVAGYSYVLHPDTKTAIRRTLRTPSGNHPNDLPPGPKHAGPNVAQTDLGSKDLPGIGAAQGKTITHTIPPGQIGNAQPIVSRSEIWYSPDLQIVVSSKHSDPRTGDSTYTLSNVQRGEPDPSLFQVPSDYTIKDAHGMHGPGPGE